MSTDQVMAIIYVAGIVLVVFAIWRTLKSMKEEL